MRDVDLSVAYSRADRGMPATLESSLERIRATALRLADELVAIWFGGPL